MQTKLLVRIALWLIVGIIVSVFAWSEARHALAQQPDEVDAVSEEQEDESPNPEALERRLDEIQDLIKKAKQAGDEDRIRKLRQEGEKILDRLEQIERSRQGEDEEEGEGELDERRRDLEFHRFELEIERLHLNIQAQRQEMAVRLAHIAESKTTSAAYAIMQATEHLEEEGAGAFLTQMLKETNNESVQRMIRHRLAQLSFHQDDPEAAKGHLKALVLEK